MLYEVITPAWVERIEILKDGASSVYGSDAIAGVVNIILKRDFEGVITSYSIHYTKLYDTHLRKIPVKHLQHCVMIRIGSWP